MQQTPNLTLPYIMPSQAQKHVTHNEAIRMLDAVVQIAVLDRDLAAPPPEPAEGDRYLVAPGAADEWSGREGELAAFQDGAWAFFAPRTGWIVWLADEAKAVAFDGGDWVPVGADPLATPEMLGITATADSYNRLTVSSDGSLFTAAGGSHRMTLNKQASGDTASILLQTNYTGHAEIGLSGDDDLQFKVSPDGGSWATGLRIEPDGRVLMPASAVSPHPDQVAARRDIRERLAQARTYFVRPDGSNANDGLTDAPGGAFATVQHALDIVFGMLDLAWYDVTIRLGDGTYGEHLRAAARHPGTGRVIIAGNPSNPGATVIAGPSGGETVQVCDGAVLVLRDLELRAATNRTLFAENGTIVLAGTVRFGAAGAAHLHAQHNGAILAGGASLVVAGNAARFAHAITGGAIAFEGASVSVAGRAFATAFAAAERCGTVTCDGASFSGSATGKRYDVKLNGVIFTNGSASFLPGNAVGTTATGGQYG